MVEFMQPICILCNFVFSDVKTCQNTSKSHVIIDLTSQAPLSVRELDLAMCVSPSSNGSKMRSLWTNQMKS